MEMTCGLGFGILLICLVQAELAGCSWAKDAQGPENSNTNSGFPPPDGIQRKFSSNFQNSNTNSGFPPPAGIQRKFSSNFQNQLKRGFFSPQSVQVQASSILPAEQSPGMSQRDGYSFRPASYMDPSFYGQKGSSATSFGPVGPGPHGSIRMQTFAKGRARKVPSGRASQGEKIRSFLPHAAAGRFYPSPQLALNTGGYRPENLLTGLVAPREGESAPVMVYDLPDPFGGSTIRRLKRPTEQETVPVQKQQQVYPPPQRVLPYKPERTSSHSGYDWSRMMQNQGPVQKPYWIETPPRPQRAAASNPDLPSVHSASKWSEFNLPYGR